MTEQLFADAVGVSHGAMQRWECPAGMAPKRADQPLVAKLLGISIAELVSRGGGQTRSRERSMRASGGNFPGRGGHLNRHRQFLAVRQILRRTPSS